MISPAQLNTIGEALYGTRWQAELARALDVNVRTMRRWIQDGAPSEYALPLSKIMSKRIFSLEKCLQTLRLTPEE